MLAEAEQNDKESTNEGSSYWNKSVPIENPKKSASTYHEVEIDFADPRNKEPLVKLSGYGIAGEAFYARNDGRNSPYNSCICDGGKSLMLRKGTAERLRAANSDLAKLNLELFVLDGYRPVECQEALWKHFMQQARKALGATASNEQLVKYASNYCSNPTIFKAEDWKTWPTHLTGGSVDLTLRRKNNGELLFMGGIFDDDSDLSKTEFFEQNTIGNSATESKSTEPKPLSKENISTIEARQNRRILYWTMIKHGFSNYHNEWWHYDFGNQMNVQGSRSITKPRAFYGRI